MRSGTILLKIMFFIFKCPKKLTPYKIFQHVLIIMLINTIFNEEWAKNLIGGNCAPNKSFLNLQRLLHANEDSLFPIIHIIISKTLCFLLFYCLASRLLDISYQKISLRHISFIFIKFLYKKHAMLILVFHF